MRIGIDGKSLLPPRSGVARYVEGLLAGCAAVPHPDSDIRLVSPAKPCRTSRWVLWDLQRATSGDYDVFHFPFYYVPLAPRCPVSVAIHDVLILERPEWFRRTCVNPIRRLMPSSARRADAVVTGSKHVAAAISALCRVPPERIRVINYGVDRTRFFPPGPGAVGSAIARYHLRPPFLLQLGAIEPRRGTDLAIAATAGIRRNYPDMELVLVGPQRAPVAGLEDAPAWVRRLGFVADDMLPGLLAGASAVLAPSRGEGFDLPVLEALACGAPVAASDIAVHREHFAQAVVSFVSGDAESLTAAVRSILEDPSLAEQLRGAGPLLADRYHWKDTALAHLQLWREIGRR